MLPTRLAFILDPYARLHRARLRGKQSLDRTIRIMVGKSSILPGIFKTCIISTSSVATNTTLLLATLHQLDRMRLYDQDIERLFRAIGLSPGTFLLLGSMAQLGYLSRKDMIDYAKGRKDFSLREVCLKSIPYRKREAQKRGKEFDETKFKADTELLVERHRTFVQGALRIVELQENVAELDPVQAAAVNKELQEMSKTLRDINQEPYNPKEDTTDDPLQATVGAKFIHTPLGKINMN